MVRAAAVSGTLLLVSGAAFAAEEAITVVVSEAGFRPTTVRARRGETLRLKLTTAAGEHCFAVDVFRVEKRVTPDKPTLVELTPDRAGTFEFYCCLEPEDRARATAGRLVVGE